MKISKLFIIALLQSVALSAGTITIKNGPGPQENYWKICFVHSSSDQGCWPDFLPAPNSSKTYSVFDSVTICRVLRSGASFDFPCKPNATYQLITHQTSDRNGQHWQTPVGASEVTQ